MKPLLIGLWPVPNIQYRPTNVRTWDATLDEESLQTKLDQADLCLEFLDFTIPLYMAEPQAVEN